MRLVRLLATLLAAQLALVFLPTAATAAPAGWYCYSTNNQNCISQFGYTGQGTWNYPVDAYGNNCTNYVAFRLSRNGAPNPGNFGNAINWDNAAAAKGFPVNQTPAVGSVAQWNTGEYGHVAYVDWVSGDGNEVAVSESSFGITGIPSSSGRRVLTRGSASWPSTFIHIKDVSQIRGSFDTVSSPAPGQLRVTGWAFDEDAKTTPLNIHVYIGGPAGDPNAQGMDIGMANVSRPDVGAAYPGVGDNHGYDKVIDVARFGNQPVYVYAINAPGTPGENVLLASKTVGIASPNPFGSLDELSSPQAGLVRVRGWAVDPSSPRTPLSVHVYAGTTYLGAIAANGSRPDVGTALPGYGDFHGYDATLMAPPGNLRVCTFGINVGVGNNNTELGCKAVAVAADIVAPETTITSAPGFTTSDPTVSFTFSASESSTFSCRLDGGDWAACTSPFSTTVAIGDHTFTVRATDSVGNVDASPAEYRFSVAPPTPPAIVNGTVVIGHRITVIRHGSRFKVDLAPDSSSVDYRFDVQQWRGGKWRTALRTRTTGARDTRIIDGPRGRYRVVVPDQHGMTGFTAGVRLRS